MTSRVTRLAASCLALAALVPVAAQPNAATLDISISPEAAHQGDVVRLILPAGKKFTADVFGKRISDELVGVDLDTPPGRYSMKIQTADGLAVTRYLRVLPKAFPTRRLQVAPAFVEPPAGELDRIAREFKITEGIFHTTSPRSWRGPFILPVDGTPTSNFGSRSYYNGQRRSPHAGVDFVAATGTPIRAVNHGTVALAGPLYFTGNTVIVDYGAGLYSLFAHLSELRVKAGDIVAPDSVVGLVGATGRVTGAHLHWSVRLQGARVDPISLVAAVRQDPK